jgi:Ca-activated chloride channel family protein
VARLAEKPDLAAKDWAELAQTTLTFGQRVKSAQQHPPEKVVRDALDAVDAGEKLDAKAADWSQLRGQLTDLLKKEEPPPPDKKPQDKNQQKQDQSKQDQQKNQQQNQDKNQPDQKPDQDKQKSDQQKSDEQKQQDQQQQQRQNQDAFGDMKDKPDQKPPKPPPPQAATQKVGGQQDKKPEDQLQDPELAMPLQKLDQVRNQDSPAKLQQMMQGQQQKTKPTGKDW